MKKRLREKDKEELEAILANYTSKTEMSDENLRSIGDCLSLILCRVFSEIIDRQDWSVDGMSAYVHSMSKEKLTLRGKVYWFSGDSRCVNYQVDIARTTSRLLYSFKFRDKIERQLLYAGKTQDGWEIKS